MVLLHDGDEFIPGVGVKVNRMSPNQLKEKEGPKDLPGWVKKSESGFLSQFQQLSKFIHITIGAISRLRGLPKLVEAIAALDRVRNEPTAAEESGDTEILDSEAKSGHQRKLERAKEEAAFAEQEIANDFPFLHGQAVVYAWSVLEAYVRGVAKNFLVHEPIALKQEVATKIKIPLADYQRMTDEGRMEYIIKEIADELRSPLEQGIGQFEIVLNAFGLGGAVPADTRKDIFELQQVRNVLVHRGGIADLRLITACPWLKLNSGQSVLISHEMFARYGAAVIRYVFIIRQRIRSYFGLSIEEWEVTNQDNRKLSNETT